MMCADILDLRNQIKVIERRADAMHMDIMDGHYCKNITLSADFLRACRSVSDLPFDAHLMTTNPNDWIEAMAKAGATWIGPHAETINVDAYRVHRTIIESGAKFGLVLNPATPLSAVKHYLNRVDLLTIMTVDVGYAGQKFIPEMLDKIREAKELREQNGWHYDIQIDGSCNNKTFAQLIEAGADVLVLGSSGLFSKSKDLDEAFDIVHQELDDICGA